MPSPLIPRQNNTCSVHVVFLKDDSPHLSGTTAKTNLFFSSNIPLHLFPMVGFFMQKHIGPYVLCAFVGTIPRFVLHLDDVLAQSEYK